MTFTKRDWDDRMCTKCSYYYEEYDGEYCQIFCGAFCHKNGQEHFGNLKSFPFKIRKSCFVLDFWHSEFSRLIVDGEMVSRPSRLAKFFYKKSYSNGVLSPLYKRGFEMALKKFGILEFEENFP